MQKKIGEKRGKKYFVNLERRLCFVQGKREERWAFSTQRFQDKTTNSTDKQVFSRDHQLETAEEDYREEVVVLGLCCSQELEQLKVTRISEKKSEINSGRIKLTESGRLAREPLKSYPNGWK